MKKNNKTIMAIVYMILGILCLIFKGNIMLYAAVCIGITMIVFGVIEIVASQIAPGAACLVFGIVLIVLDRVMVSLVLYIAAIAIIVAGVIRIAAFSKTKAVNDSYLQAEVIRAVLTMVCGMLLLVNQALAVSVVFTVIGVLLLIAGVFAYVGDN